MNKAQIAGLVTEFVKAYDAEAKDRVWKQHSDIFRRFWSERILAPDTASLTDDECDKIIRILDRNGKGNTKESEAVARAMVPQGAWRRMFHGLKTTPELSRLVDSIFKERDLIKKAELIDKLYNVNEINKNWLTGESGNVLDALLAAYDPVNNLTVVSLNDRKLQLDFLELKLPFVWDHVSIGQKIVQSNSLLREGVRNFGLDGSARTQSCFWYFDPMRQLWKPNHSVIRTDKEVVMVSVPQDSGIGMNKEEDDHEVRESIQIQAALADIGSQMGFKIWLPRADRVRVLTKWTPEPEDLLDDLPLNFDRTLMKTIEQIDVIWLKRRSIVRAFEVEHTTSVYSGLLRMADLLALAPNLDIKLHIVAPILRREKVFSEIKRPVFSLLEGHPLSEICSFLSYDSISELHEDKHLGFLRDRVLEDYEERAEEDED
jgi:hypothetical protein